MKLVHSVKLAVPEMEKEHSLWRLASSCGKGAIPLVGAPTWTRGSVNSSTPREKKSGCLVSLAFTFLAYILFVLDLALTCLLLD